MPRLLCCEISVVMDREGGLVSVEGVMGAGVVWIGAVTSLLWCFGLTCYQRRRSIVEFSDELIVDGVDFEKSQTQSSFVSMADTAVDFLCHLFAFFAEHQTDGAFCSFCKVNVRLKLYKGSTNTHVTGPSFNGLTVCELKECKFVNEKAFVVTAI